jgi:hypothetical protein
LHEDYIEGSSLDIKGETVYHGTILYNLGGVRNSEPTDENLTKHGLNAVFCYSKDNRYQTRTYRGHTLIPGTSIGLGVDVVLESFGKDQLNNRNNPGHQKAYDEKELRITGFIVHWCDLLEQSYANHEPPRP